MFTAVGIILFILCDLTVILAVNTNECCSTIPEAARGCREICHQLSVSGKQVEQISLLASAPSECPQNLLDFWTCAKKSLPVLLELGTFSGRPCCNLTKTKACREACIKAQSEADVEAQCSHSTEDAKLYECIERQRDGEKCCGKAVATDSLTCKATCWNMYLTNTITSHESKKTLRERCTGRNREVVQCLQKQTRTTRQSSNIESLHCCENTDNDTCRKVCTETLRSESNPDQIIEKLIVACGRVDIIDPLYKCFLIPNYPNRPIAGMDSAKLHCCEKAVSKRCGALCVKTHSWKWASIAKFEENCGYLSSPISTQELEMHSCLKDVEQPCQLGCQGLQYCTNMNNRPAEHFRSCTREADTAARDDILIWQKGKINLPNLSIPVKDIRNCEPEMWKAIACTYQIKPCSRKPTPTQICREDCVYIMNKCVDKTQLQGQVVTDVCKRLPIIASGECISVKPYTDESPVNGIQSEVTHPCKYNTCKDDEVCVLYRRKCRHSAKCPHYVCRKGCKMGQVSRVMVPYNTDVVIPVHKNAEENSNSCRRYKVCHCSHTGHLGNCDDIPCMRNDHCVLDTGVIDSGQHYTTGCSDCVCHGGEKICSQRQCPASAIVNQLEFADVRNCQCSRKYEPVCASNGKTYPNQCISRCAGQTLFTQGHCNGYDPCASSPCETGYSCIVNRQACFSHGKSPCLQYKCVAITECNKHKHEPVCDIHDMEYTNDCVLLSKGKAMKYRGHCQVRQCSNSGSVCGHDGETYTSECAALAARITVDYYGPCKTFGYSLATVDGMDPTETLCSNVECPAVVPSGCRGIIPPWSCCPICAAELRILISESWATVSINVRKGPITLNKILNALSQMISVSECDVYGYLGYDNDIIVLVAPVTDKPTVLQATACVKEAERFEYLIKSRSPSVTSDLILTPLLYAKLRTHVMTMTSTASAFYTQPLLVTLTLLLIHFSHKILGIV